MEKLRGEVTLFHDEFIQFPLLHIFQKDIFLDGRLSNQSIDRHISCLPNSVATILCVWFNTPEKKKEVLLTCACLSIAGFQSVS